MVFIFLFIYQLYFTLFKKKNCGKKQNLNSAFQPLALSLLMTCLLIEIQSCELYNMKTLNKESFK